MKILIALPCYNEEKLLAASVAQVVNYCRAAFVDEWKIVVADNASHDATPIIGRDLMSRYPGVEYIHVATRGKGAAIRAAWEYDSADVYCFMDADLATDLSALTAGLAAIKRGAQVVYGSRVHVDSRVTRTPMRRVWSWGYRQLLYRTLGTGITDAPCGFKMITAQVAETVLPHVKNTGWFFDSELILLAEHAGYRVQSVPVTWIDPREGTDKTRVNVLSLIREYWYQVMNLRRRIR